MGPVERLQEPRRTLIKHRHRRGLSGPLETVDALKLLEQPAGVLLDLLPTMLPRLRQGDEDPRESGHPVAIDGRIVGSAVKGPPIRRQKDRHRPSTVPCHHLDRVHVDGVEVWTLLPIDLDVDEVLVHEAGDRLVLERLVLHDVAPVAGRVADAQENRPILRAGPGKCLLSPRVPVNGIVGVLEEVRARLVNQSIGELRLPCILLCLYHNHSLDPPSGRFCCFLEYDPATIPIPTREKNRDGRRELFPIRGKEATIL